MTDHDSGYKRIFSHPRLVQELLRFLRGLLRGRFLGQLDLSSLEKVGASFVSDRWSERIWVLRLLRRIMPGITISETAEWEDLTMLEETLSEWFEKARKEGHREGRAEGMRQMLVELLEQRFGPLPAGVRRQVKATSSPAKLGRLARQALTAGSLAELGLDPR